MCHPNGIVICFQGFVLHEENDVLYFYWTPYDRIDEQPKK